MQESPDNIPRLTNPFSPNTSPEQEHQPKKVREKYIWKDGIERAHRPMDLYLNEVLDKLDQNQVLIVQAETGVGKTTRIPQAILDHDPNAQIYMTQTKRPPVRMNGEHIAKEMNTPPGEIVGWTLRGETPVKSEKTRLTLLIDQSLTNRIRHEQKLPEGYIIIDEAHERTVQIDILIALIREYLPNSPKTKVVITSATIDAEKFRSFFNAADPILAQNEQLYQVEINKTILMRNEHHTQGAIRAVGTEVLEKWANKTLSIPGVKPDSDRQTVESGSVLILLPGKEDIANVMEAILKKAAELNVLDSIEILQCHGQMDKREQDLVSKPVAPGTLRIVCATEIIRSSVTVPKVVGVIDSLQVKRHTTDHNGVTHLGKVTVSGAEADQGKGRAGREQPGFYIPISFKGDKDTVDEYQRITRRSNNPEYWPQPAIQREALTSVILQIAAVGLSIRSLEMLDKPSEQKINTAITRLQKIGALDGEENITKLGETLVQFPLDPEKARTLITAEKLGVLPETIIATAILENEGLQYVPRLDQETVIVNRTVLSKILDGHKPGWSRQKYTIENLPSWVSDLGNERYKVNVQDPNFPLIDKSRSVALLVWKEFADDSQSDFFTSVQVYRAFKAEQKRLKDSTDEELGMPTDKFIINSARRRKIEDLEKQWCIDHFINYKKMLLIDATVRDLREEVRSSPMHLSENVYERRNYSSDNLTKALLSGLVDNIASRVSGDSYTGPMAEDMTKSSSSIVEVNPEFILIGGVRKSEVATRRGTKTMHFADMIAKVEPNWFMEVMPQLCKQDLVQSTIRYDAETHTVVVQQNTFYGLQKVKEEFIPAKGESATAKLAQALIEGRTGHKSEAENRTKTERVVELLKRDTNEIDFVKRLESWYVLQLQNATSLDEIINFDLSLQTETLTELLGFDYAVFETRVLHEKPDFVVIEEVRYELTYIDTLNSSGAQSSSGSLFGGAKFGGAPSTFGPQTTGSPFGGSRFGDGGSTSSRFGGNTGSSRFGGGSGASSQVNSDISKSTARYIAKLALPISVVRSFSWDLLPKLEGYDVELTLTDQGYEDTNDLFANRSSTDSINILLKKIEDRRQQLAWKAYIDSKSGFGSGFGTTQSQTIEVPYPNPLPDLPEPEVWDETTGSRAYPAYSNLRGFGGYGTNDGTTKWKIEWYRTQEEANTASIQAHEALEKAQEEVFEKQHFDELTKQAQELYVEVEKEFLAINQEDLEPYGFAEGEFLGVMGSGFDSLERRLSLAKMYTGSDSFSALPIKAIKELTEIRQRLQRAQDYFNTQGQEIIRIRNEKENIESPEKPDGVVGAFIYRTASGHLIASPSADLTNGGRSSREYFLEGNGVQPLTDEQSDELDTLIKPDRLIGAVSSRRWYQIPESGTFWRRVLYVSRKDGGRTGFVLQEVPTEPGLYAIFHDYDSFDDAKAFKASVHPASYQMGNKPENVSNKLFDITKWLERKESQFGGRLYVGRKGTVDENMRKEVWHDARTLFSKFSNSGRTWITDEELEMEQLSNPEDELILNDPVDTIIGEVKRKEPPIIREVVRAVMTPEKTLRIGRYIELLNEQVNSLLQIVKQDKRSDLGRWRLAVAALASKDYEGLKAVVDLQLTETERTEIIKALEKAQSEAKTHNRNNLSEVEKLISEALQHIELAKLLMQAKQNELVQAYFGNDPEGIESFSRKIAQKLLNELETWGQLPPENLLDTLIVQVIDQMTS